MDFLIYVSFFVRYAEWPFVYENEVVRGFARTPVFVVRSEQAVLNSILLRFEKTLDFRNGDVWGFRVFDGGLAADWLLP